LICSPDRIEGTKAFPIVEPLHLITHDEALRGYPASIHFV
jgi:hypothetical protein